MRISKGIFLPLAAVSIAFAQTPPPQFEVASIRPSAEGPQGQIAAGVHIDGAQVRIAALTLKEYIGIAYKVKYSQVAGPDWIGSDRFDIAATIPSGAKPAQIPEMLQALLTDRFQLKFHREKRDLPVYALVLGKGPLKLKEVPPSEDNAQNKGEAPGSINVAAGGSAAGISENLGNRSSWSFVPNRFEAQKLSMDVFVRSLERFADRPIVDETALKGQYDFAFDVSPEDYRVMLIRSAIAAGVPLSPRAMRLVEGTSSASLSDALEQVGLKLDARKEPLDVIVIDQANKTPTAN
jgi:uncharacterized protein (TIGR03435 family)